ncbi:MAG: hypothetical protein MUC88_17465 [Planctomycetes bacterium]|nr:hypothetical protein [Planctomycetota bacterium]
MRIGNRVFFASPRMSDTGPGPAFHHLRQLGKLIANRADALGGIYDIYDLDGNVLRPAFITTDNDVGTGIAYDGTDSFVSDIFSSTLLSPPA